MTAYDFDYAGTNLSSKGYEICQFGESSGFNVSNSGTNLNFRKIKQLRSGKFSFASSDYNDAIEIRFSIVRKDGKEISVEEESDILRWLNRHVPYKLRFLNGGLENLIFDGSFNAHKVEHRGRCVGFNLVFTTVYPFAHLDPVTIDFSLSGENSEFVITDVSDEIGYSYPAKMTITCKESGDVKISNSIENRTMTILNCTKGEILTLDCVNQIISTSKSSHNVYNDFNYAFFRVANNYESRENKISSSLNCDISVTYSPTKKVVF